MKFFLPPKYSFLFIINIFFILGLNCLTSPFRPVKLEKGVNSGGSVSFVKGEEEYSDSANEKQYYTRIQLDLGYYTEYDLYAGIRFSLYNPFASAFELYYNYLNIRNFSLGLGLEIIPFFFVEGGLGGFPGIYTLAGYSVKNSEIGIGYKYNRDTDTSAGAEQSAYREMWIQYWYRYNKKIQIGFALAYLKSDDISSKYDVSGRLRYRDLESPNAWNLRIGFHTVLPENIF